MVWRKLEEDDHEDHGHEEDHDELRTARILMIIFVILAGLVVFLPYTPMVRNSSAKNNQDGEAQTDTKVCKGRMHQFSNCFAAGMLLSLSIVHILPEALEAYATYLKNHASEGEEDDHDDHDDHRRLLK